MLPKKIIFIALISFCGNLLAHNELTGVVFEFISKNEKQPLEGASIHWLGTNTVTYTNKQGYFEIENENHNHDLVISFVGFKTDTIEIDHETKGIEVTLIPEAFMNEVEIVGKKRNLQFEHSALPQINIQKEELHKGACCNLSEAFETNASIDVSYGDAATGSRNIKMLGLAGKYVAIMKDNTPFIHGYNQHMGLNHLPGSWIGGIALTKGIGSVTTGHEDITGQINTQFIQPDTNENNLINVYFNNEGRLESNLVLHQQVGKNWTTNLLFHQNNRFIEQDRNQDGFMDLPIGNMYNAANLWKGKIDRWWFHFQIQALYSNMNAGTINNNDYPIGMEAFYQDSYFKTSYNTPNDAIALIVSQKYFDHLGNYGGSTFNTYQRSLNANLNYTHYFGCAENTLVLGSQFYTDQMNEVHFTTNTSMDQNNIGGFAEYTLNEVDNFQLILGARADNHSIWGLNFTPRIHAKWQVTESFVLKGSSGKGFRTAFGYPENQKYFLSSRMPVFQLSARGFEEAITSGIMAKLDLDINKRHGSIIIDAFNTSFSNKLIVDQYLSSSIINFYQSTDLAYSNAIQIEWWQEITRRIEIRMAYKYTQAKETYLNNGLLTIPMTTNHRGFFNFYYKTRNDWEMDYTLQVVGPKTLINRTTSPWYSLSNSQVTKTFNEKNALYLGIENVFNFRQNNPIINAENPNSEGFDATQVWGPIFGRMVYIGTRINF